MFVVPQLLNAVSKAVLLKPQEDEKDIVDAYAALKVRT